MDKHAKTKISSGTPSLRHLVVRQRHPDRGGVVDCTEPVNETTALISMIERAARDPSVDLDKMERLFAMKERAEDRRSETEFNAAMAATQAELLPVSRNRKNEHTGAKYADLYAIADTALPFVHKHGFGLSFSQCPSSVANCIGVECTVTHAAGHSKTYRFDVPLDAAGSQGKTNKTATQALGSTLTYGRRYAIINVFNIAVTDDDGNAAATTPQAPVTDQDIASFREALQAKNVKEGEVCNLFSVESIDDLTRKQFDDAVKRLAKTPVRKP